MGGLGLSLELAPKRAKPKCAQPNAPWVKCCICRKKIKTCERKKPTRGNSYLCPAHPKGSQLPNKKWVCSTKCWDVVVGIKENLVRGYQATAKERREEIKPWSHAGLQVWQKDEQEKAKK